MPKISLTMHDDPLTARDRRRERWLQDQVKTTARRRLDAERERRTSPARRFLQRLDLARAMEREQAEAAYR